MSSTNVATNYLSPYNVKYHNVTEFADSLDQIGTIANYFTTVAEFHQIKVSSKMIVGSSDDPGDYYLEVHGESIFKKYNLYDDLLLTVEGSTNIDNVLTVSGESYFLSDVSMDDNLYVLDNVDVSNDVYIHKNLHVDQDASINELYVYGNSKLDNLTTAEIVLVTSTSTFQDDASFETNVFINNNLDVSGESTFENHVQINKTLNVVGVSTLESNLFVLDNVDVSNDVYIHKNLHVDQDASINELYVYGNTTLDNLTTAEIVLVTSTSTFQDDASFETNIFINNNLDVSGESTFENHVQINKTLNVVGVSTMDSNIFVLDNVDVSNDVYIHKNLHVDQDISMNELYVYGNSTLDNLTTLETLLVTSTSNFISDVSFQMNVYIDDNLDISGESTFENHVQINKTLDVVGLATLDNMQVSEDINFTGQSRLFRVSGTSQFDNNVNIYDDVLIEGKTLSITGATGICNIGGNLYVPNIKCSVITADIFQKSGIYTQNLNRLYVNEFEGYQYADGDSSGNDIILSEKEVGYYTDVNNNISSTPYSDVSNDIIKSDLVLYTDGSGNSVSLSYASFETYYDAEGVEFLVSDITDGTFQDINGNNYNSAYDENNNLRTNIVKYTYINNTIVDLSYNIDTDYKDTSTNNRFYVRKQESGLFSDGTNNYVSMYDDYGTIRDGVTTYNDRYGTSENITYVYERGTVSMYQNVDIYLASVTQVQNDLVIGSKLYKPKDDDFESIAISESGNVSTHINTISDLHIDISNDFIDTSLNIVARQGEGLGIYYDGDVTIGNPSHTYDDISNSRGRDLTLYGDIRIKQGGQLIIEDGSMTSLTILQKFSDILNIQNIGTGPGVIVNQQDSTYHDIVHFQDNSDNVFVVGAEGNTIISGKLHIGIDKSLITGSGSIGNNNNDNMGIYNDFEIKGISKDDASYNFFVNGNTLIKNDLDISGSLYLDDYFQLNTIQNNSIFQINDISGYTSDYIFDISTVVVTKHENMNTTSTPIMYLGRTGVANSGYAEFAMCQYDASDTEPLVKMEFNLDNTSANDKTNVLTLTAKDGGYVGINNNNPENNLDVSGKIRMDGNIEFKGNLTTFNSPTTINDDISINSTINVNHDISFNKNVDISDNLVVHKEIRLFEEYTNKFTGNNAEIKKYGKIEYKNDSVTSKDNLYIENVKGGDIIFKTYTYDTESNSEERVIIHDNGDVSFNHSIDILNNVTVGGTMMSSSDKRIKANITPLENCLDKIDSISGYQYNRTDLIDTEKIHVGVIAQDVEEVYPELVETNKLDIKQVNYNSLIAVLVECVKELKQENKELKQRIINLENK